VAIKHSLAVQFGENVALICCDDHTLHNSLSQYFRHCQGQLLAPVVTYQITYKANESWQLFRDGTSLCYFPSQITLIQYLIHNIPTMLIKHCQNKLLFHAAGLAYQDRGLILCGKSGCGKSTLAAWLTASGFTYLTDELVGVELGQDRRMSGLARPFGLKKGSEFVWKHWLGEIDGQKQLRFSDGTVWLDPELLHPSCIRSTAYPHVLLFPRYVAGEPFTANALSAAEAVFGLMQHLINAQNLPNWGFSAVTRLSRQIRAYSFDYSDIEMATTWIKQIGVFPT